MNCLMFDLSLEHVLCQEAQEHDCMNCRLIVENIFITCKYVTTAKDMPRLRARCIIINFVHTIHEDKVCKNNADRARCDGCWQLWQCLQCKNRLNKSEFSHWLDEFPSRKHTGRCKLARCNPCMRKKRDSAQEMSKRDADAVMKKRRTNS